MLELAVASGCLLTLTVGWCLPTPDRPFIKLFFELLNHVRRMTVWYISAVISEIRKSRKESQKRKKIEHAKARRSKTFDEYLSELSVPIEHFVQPDFRTGNEAKNSDFSSNPDCENLSSISTKMFSEDEIREIKRQIFQKHLARIRTINETHEATIDSLAAGHQEELTELQRQHSQDKAKLEQQWKATLQTTENELKARVSELSRELDRLTRPDPRAEAKEQFRQIQLMRGAGISRNKIFQQVLDGKMVGNSRIKCQREYDDLIFAYGVDWLRELHSYGLSSQKIVKAVWGDFRGDSEADYIKRVEKAIECQAVPNDAPNNVIRLHRVS